MLIFVRLKCLGMKCAPTTGGDLSSDAARSATHVAKATTRRAAVPLEIITSATRSVQKT